MNEARYIKWRDTDDEQICFVMNFVGYPVLKCNRISEAMDYCNQINEEHEDACYYVCDNNYQIILAE